MVILVYLVVSFHPLLVVKRWNDFKGLINVRVVPAALGSF